MPIAVYWVDKDQTIIYLKFEGQWFWTEFDTAFNRIRDMLVDIDHPVDFIWDITHVTLMPPDLALRLREYDPWNALQVGIYVMIGADKFIQTFWELTRKVYSHVPKIHFVDDEAAAHSFLEKYRRLHPPVY